MFKEFEDYIIAGAVIYGAVKFGKALVGTAFKTIEEINRINTESSHEWDKWTLSRYKYISKKLNENNATAAARKEAYEHAFMLIEKHLNFYIDNSVARKNALAFNQRYIDAIRAI